MDKVYIVHEITELEEHFIDVFEDKEDAENYIRGRANFHTKNRDYLIVKEDHDTDNNLFITIKYKNIDEKLNHSKSRRDDSLHYRMYYISKEFVHNKVK